MDETTQQPKTIDSYISGFPPRVQAILDELRRTIRELAPTAEETINYGIPTFRLNGNLVHFAAFEHHIGFYPTPSAMEAFEQALSPYKRAKGSVQFPIDKPLPLELIRQIVKYRVEQALAPKVKRSSTGRQKD